MYTKMYTNKANRGKTLESDIETANQYYKMQRIAEINKRPTPIKVIKQQQKYITKAVWDKKSTVDFDGAIKGGKAIFFDAKQTQNKTNFPLNNIDYHQIEYLETQSRLGSISFLVIEFVTLREYYFVPWIVAMNYITAAQTGQGRKSIPIADFRERSDIYKISTKDGYLNYLEPIFKGYYSN